MDVFKTQTLKITHDFLRLIGEIDEFKGAWRAFGTLAPERLSALRHVATIESIGSRQSQVLTSGQFAPYRHLFPSGHHSMRTLLESIAAINNMA